MAPSGNTLSGAKYLSDYAKNKGCFCCDKKGYLKAHYPKFKGKCGGRPSCKVCEWCGQMGHTKNMY